MTGVKHASSGRFELPRPAVDAIWLFTPEGERGWAPGWNPRYVAGEPSEAPGTVFTTTAHNSETVWVIVEINRSGGFATYARLTPGHHAGIVRVQCEDARPGHSTVTVSYDMSLLGDRELSGFDAYAPAHFDEMMRDWSETIRTFLQSQVG